MPTPAAVSQPLNRALLAFNQTIANLDSNRVTRTLGIVQHAIGGNPAFKYVQLSSPGVTTLDAANAALFSALLAAHTAGYPYDCTTQKPNGFRETHVPSIVFVNLQ